ncbi:HD domain-containing protein [Candidatus Uhrbacteria bacterium]|nr:HD domain-containing protein [Candidatus Uhrbacteria bacterium]
MIDFSKQNSGLIEAACELATKILNTQYSIPNTPIRALIVGGFVRDTLLGIPSHDLDIEVYGINAEQLESLLNELYPGQVNVVGRTFGIFKIRLADGSDFDVSIPRRDSKIGEGHKGFAVEGDPNMSVEEAARRRDFTINAMMVDPLTNELIDPFDGQKDLAAKTLRMVDEKTFQEDPLRVYRALQFAARFNLTVEPQTFELMRMMTLRGDLSELSPERITDEIKKLLLKAERPSIGLELAWDLGLIERDYPELFILKQTPQEPEWHPEGDVWIHTLMVIDQAARIVRREPGFTEEEKLQVVFGALCHDLGKPATTKLAPKDGIMRLRSLGHEEAGEEPTLTLCTKWLFGESVTHAAIMGATQHLKPGIWFRLKERGDLTDEQYANAVRKLLKRIYPVSWRVLIAVAEADHRGRAFADNETSPYDIGTFFTSTIINHEFDKEPTKPLIQGRDLLERGLSPSPRFGEVIAQIETARDEGKIKTREEALKLLTKILKNNG